MNDAPTAEVLTLSTTEDTALNLVLNGSDVDVGPLSYLVVNQPSHGTLRGKAPDLIYTPDENYEGDESCSYKVNDGTVDSDTVLSNISLIAVNDVPEAQAATLVTNEDAPQSVKARYEYQGHSPR